MSCLIKRYCSPFWTNIAKTMEEDRSTAIRRLIKKAVSGEKVELAVKRFQEGVPFRKAADMAGLDSRDFQTGSVISVASPCDSSVSFARKRMKRLRVNITDSGGLQEETTTALGIPCFTIRKDL